MNYILTNGCFDLFHVGHAAYLQQLKVLASQLEAKLIIFVNDDDSVSALKGLGRPIMPYEARAAMVGYWADMVVPVADIDCTQAMSDFIDRQMPGTYIYCKEAGAESGPEGVWARGRQFPIMTFSRMEGMSTTEIIERIQLRATQQNSVLGQGRDAYPGHREAAERERNRLIAGSSTSITGAAGYGLRSGDSYKSSSYRPGGVLGGSAANADKRAEAAAVGGRRRDD